MDHVAGYALCLDMTARDIQEDCKSKGLPWTLAKAFNTSCPISEFIPKERIPDPGNVTLWLKVNDQLRQNGCTAEMIFSIPFLISYISEIITLEEGDLILTGTPKGVSAVQQHDELQAGIEDVITMNFKPQRPVLGLSTVTRVPCTSISHHSGASYHPSLSIGPQGPLGAGVSINGEPGE
ncbi:unnamed protein product [Gadus morhua 'NCC']